MKTTHNNTNDIIKSARVYTQGSILHIDFRMHATVKLPKGYKGNRIRFSTNVKDTKIARNKMEKAKLTYASDYYYNLMERVENKEAVLFEDIADNALAEVAVNRRKDDSTKDYQNILTADVLPTFGEMALKDILPSHIKKWQVFMSEDGISQSRFNKRYYVLKRVLDYATENNYIDKNPILSVKRSSKLFAKAQAKEKETFTLQEQDALLNYVYTGESKKEIRQSKFIVAFLHVLLLTGCRVGEAMALEWDDIDFNSDTVCISKSIRKGITSSTKTGVSRTIPMVQRLKKALLTWRESNIRSKYLFNVTNKRTPYKESRSIVDSMYRPLLEKLNIPFIVMYNCRHTFASLGMENNIPVPIISQCLGHSTTATTQRFYVRLGNLGLDNSRAELEKFLSA